ncbi:DUF4340 domain-containing protein [Candidatus Nitrosacidococcus tergens]|uniref:DUF4340 domain-containing protein n=1 Tax=Candidatus Nitrosacidococcus tergens TaxID=553981 RepID=A0A7G1QBK6_9GAMM|nr:DUF4340 domain-containing protein [Candidatus Nitrosacidococcus tergens]CAB1277100.1 conserved protein of unknown function [Candidatus Nitrosacidococcus tergens]
MNTRILLNLGLSAAVIILALIFFYGPDKSEDKVETSPLTSTNADKIDTIKIIHTQSQNQIQFKKKEKGKWEIVAPIQAPANIVKVETLLDILKTPSYSHYSVENINLGELKLNLPEINLYLNNTKFGFGSTEPINHRRYVLLKDTVHLVDDIVFPSISGNSAKFVDPALLPGNKEITEIHLPLVTTSGGNPNVDVKHTIILKQEKGHWTAEGTTDHRFSTGSIVKLVQAWQDQTTRQVDLRGNKAVLATIEVIQGEGTAPIRFELLSDLPQLILARPDFGVQYNLPALAWKNLFQLTQEEQVSPGLTDDNQGD